MTIHRMLRRCRANTSVGYPYMCLTLDSCERSEVVLLLMGCGLLLILHLYAHTDEYLDMSCSETVNKMRHAFDNKLATDTRSYLISWYRLPYFIAVRPATFHRNFDRCTFKNCKISISRADVCKSDAVIFKLRYLRKLRYSTNRPRGQIWIIAEEESPPTWYFDFPWWSSSGYRNKFNWTMSYDKSISDIFLPYGLITKKSHRVKRDYLAIAQSKTKDAVIVTSNCKTNSLRMEYIAELKKYINVDVFGECGSAFNCGVKEIHDDCFANLTTHYRFYLAFENNLCRGYRSEKFYDNFNYDVILVARGDMSLFKKDGSDPSDAYITATDFQSAKDLGQYLASLSSSPERYAKLLEIKDGYTSLPYEKVYDRALCDICERMNNQDRYRNQVKSLTKWRDLERACHMPTHVV